MKSLRTMLALTALAFVCATAQAQQAAPATPQQDYSQDKPGPADRRVKKIVDMLQRNLSLNDAQRQDVEKIMTSTSHELEHQRATQPDRTAYRQQADAAMQNALNKVDGLLTPTQKEAFKNLRYHWEAQRTHTLGMDREASAH